MAQKALVALGGAALALLVVSAISVPAEARKGGGHGGGGGGGGGGHGWSGGGAGGGGGGGSSYRSFGGGGGSSYSGYKAGPNFSPSVRLRDGPGSYSGQSYRPRMGSHDGHGGHGHRRFHRRHFIGVPTYFGSDYYYGYYGDGCYWLRRRALATGSPYWWSRYYACIGDYGGPYD